MKIWNIRITSRKTLIAVVLAGFHALAVDAADTPPVPESRPVFDIPRLQNIVVDGNPGDWGDAGFRVDSMMSADGFIKPVSDLDSRLRLGWDERGLLILLTVHDDAFVENASDARLWENDSVQFYMADRVGGREMVEAVVAPGMDAAHPDLRVHLNDHQEDENLKKSKPAITVERTKIDGGYVMEALLPWENIGIKPQAGSEFGFQVVVNDSDRHAGRLTHAAWYPADGALTNTAWTQHLRLAEKPGAPVLAAGRGFYFGLKSVGVTVQGVPELAGKKVLVKAGGKLVASGVLGKSGGRAVATLKAPCSLVGTKGANLEIFAGNSLIDAVALPPVADAKGMGPHGIQCVFRPFCFTGNKFPECEVADPAAARSLFGSYKIAVSYYDEHFNPVKSAENPGRYGAIVEIHPQGGKVVKSYCILCRLPEKVTWPPAKFPLDAGFLTDLGINPEVIQEQTGMLNRYLGSPARDSFASSRESALLISWIMTVPPGTHPAIPNDPGNSYMQWIYGLKRKTGNLIPMEYMVQLPAGSKKSKDKKWPAILYLHGTGGIDMSMEELRDNSLPKYAMEHRKDFPFILITPHCPRDPGGWVVPALDDFWDQMMKKYPIDPDRVYLTGESLGGGACWPLAVEHPDRFAAIAPIAGNGLGESLNADRIADLPVWNFHGLIDHDVPIITSYQRVEALRKLHGRVRFTVYPEGDHYIWDDVYSRSELYSWFLAQVRGKPAQPKAAVQGTAPSDERAIENW